MDDNEKDRLCEVRQSLKAVSDYIPAVTQPPSVVGPWRAKVFKSGNSLALRLPKALGLEAGMEMELTAMLGGGYALDLVQPPRRTIDISGFAGMLPGFKPAPREDFEERPSAVARRKALLGE